MRFYKKIMNEKLFSDQETGVNACFVICEEQKHGIAEIFPCFPTGPRGRLAQRH